MARTRINVSAPYAALDAARSERQLSWRQPAATVGARPDSFPGMTRCPICRPLPGFFS
jgi:hypothetical protein